MLFINETYDVPVRPRCVRTGLRLAK